MKRRFRQVTIWSNGFIQEYAALNSGGYESVEHLQKSLGDRRKTSPEHYAVEKIPGGLRIRELKPAFPMSLPGVLRTDEITLV